MLFPEQRPPQKKNPTFFRGTAWGGKQWSPGYGGETQSKDSCCSSGPSLRVNSWSARKGAFWAEPHWFTSRGRVRNCLGKGGTFSQGWWMNHKACAWITVEAINADTQDQLTGGVTYHCTQGRRKNQPKRKPIPHSLLLRPIANRAGCSGSAPDPTTWKELNFMHQNRSSAFHNTQELLSPGSQGLRGDSSMNYHCHHASSSTWKDSFSSNRLIMCIE